MWDTIKRTKRPGHGNWTLLLCEELSLHELITHKFINTSFPLINLFSHLFSSVWTHRYLFYTLSYNPILLSLITQSVLALAIGSSFGWLLCVFGITLSMLYGLCCCYLFVSVWFGFFGLSSGFVFSISLHLARRDAMGPSCLFPALVLESTGPWFLWLENGIKKPSSGYWVSSLDRKSVV